MNRKDLFYTLSLVVIAALLLANLLRPTAPAAFDLPATAGQPVAISAAGDSAWALVGNRVFFVSLRPRGDISNRIINQIDAQELK
jgi:hypothetical protein